MATSWNYIEDTDVATLKSLETVFSNLISVVIGLLGIVTFVMILIGGFQYLISAGDAKKTEAAQATLTKGVIGLVLAVASYFIILAIEKFTEVSLLNFSVGLNP